MWIRRDEPFSHIGAAQTNANNLSVAINASLAQMMEVRLDFIARVAPQAELDLLVVANSSLSQMQALRSHFLDHDAPAIMRQLQTFNGSAALEQLAALGTTQQWTPQLQFGGLSTGITYLPATQGTYAVIGELVCVFLDIELTSKGTATGDATVGNLPAQFSNAEVIPVYTRAAGITVTTQMGLRLQHGVFHLEAGSNGNIVPVTDQAFAYDSSLEAAGCWQM